MKYQRFKTVSVFGSDLSEYEHKHLSYENAPCIVDKSAFTPVTEQLKALQRGNIHDTNMTYHFPDGVDTGAKLGVANRRGVDIAEISTDVRIRQEKIKSEVAKAEAKMQTELKVKAQLDTVKTSE